LDDAEKSGLQKLAAHGTRLVINGVDATGLADAPHVFRNPQDPGAAYQAALEKDFDHTSPERAQAFLEQLRSGLDFSIEASPTAATHIASVAGSSCVFFANFSGLRGHETASQTPLTKVRISFGPDAPARLRLLHFLGEEEVVEPEPGSPGVFRLPPIQKGAVVCAAAQADDR
jgi:hypothetical protein